MMNSIKDLFFSIIRSEVFGETAEIPDSLSEENLNVLYKLSKKHDLAHIVASALEKHNLLAYGIGREFTKQKLLAVYRREQLDFEEARICKLFEENGIDHIPLKGAIIKTLYPESWMRTSSDIDILVKPQDRKKAVSLITEKLGFRQDTDAERDCSLISKNNVNLELHFAITSNEKKLNTVLERVWDFAYASDNGGYKHLLKDEFFIAYHIAHMQIHFIEGGCGVRPFIDLLLYTRSANGCEKEILALLDECGSADFYRGIKSLCEVWFCDAEHTQLTESMERFILSGGVYGTRENLGATGKHKEGSFAKYVATRIFMPKEKLRLLYPKIDKYPILIPYYQVKRWFKFFDKDVRTSAKNELAGNKNASYTDEMLKELGL